MFKLRHLLLREPDTGCVESGNPLDSRVLSTKGHVLSKAQHRVTRVKQSAIPVLFQHTPDPFNGVVFAVIGRIICQIHRHLKTINEGSQPLHELRATAVIFRAIVQVQDQGCDLRKPLAQRYPAIHQAIDHEITGDFGRGEVEKEFIMLGQKNAEGCEFGIWLKVMIGSFDANP